MGTRESPENRGRITVGEEEPSTESGASRGYPGSAEGFPRASGERRGTLPTLPGIPVEAATQLPGRYRDLGRIGHGNMGEVRRVHDTTLERDVAMKIVHVGLVDDPELRRRLFDEAKLTAALDHPAIVAVHDMGRLDDGRSWFTMRIVAGETLGAVVGRWPRARLLSAFETTCRAVAYAHERGVVHRDLKPDNVMVGAFGEVQVLDWGLAGAAAGSLGIVGTPRYMSPEQARGLAATPASDAYGLGALLYTLLTGAPPYADLPAGILGVLEGPPATPRSGDTTLDALCLAAMAMDPAQRPTARAIADEVRGVLDGERARERAAAAWREAEALAEAPAAARRRAEALRADARRILDAVRPTDPTSNKEGGWALEDAAVALEAEAELAELRYVESLRAALGHDPGFGPARIALAAHYRGRLVAAEAGRDPRASRSYELLLRGVDETATAWLDATGSLSVRTDPPAHAALYRVTTERRRRVPLFVEDLGATPIRRALPPGDYVVDLRVGDTTVAHPLRVLRAEQVDATLRLVEPGPDAVLVPGGWFTPGGDPHAPDAHPSRRVWVEGFVITRHPVTLRQYAAFLDDRRASGAPTDWLMPRDASGPPIVIWTDAGHVPGPDINGRVWGLDEPVVLVDWWCATAYVAWWAAQTGEPWRLPHDLEWEKAARGADGRHFPWGDHLDPTWCRMQASHTGVFTTGSVEDHPDDVSPYGVRGLGGNVRDWCGNAYQREGLAEGATVDTVFPSEARHRAVRGGSFSSVADFCRSAARFGAPPEQRLTSLGFRLARSVSSAD